MTLLALLIVGAAGAVGTGWALPRGGAAARIGVLGGVAALLLVAVLAAASPTPVSLAADATGAVPGTLWNGALVPGGYFRLVIVLWAATSACLVGIAWLLRGTAGLRGLLPGTLAALVGAAVTLCASSPALGIVAAGATGLASVPVVLANQRAASAGVAAREIRIAVAPAAVVLAVAAVVPVLGRLVLANPDGPASSPSSGTPAAIAFGLLAIALVVAARVGAIPYHVRIAALADTVPAGALPLVAAWLPLPLVAAGVGVATGELAPLALPVGSAQAVIVALTLLATLAAAVVAFLQDDLRHAVGYLTLADLGIVVLALAALDPGAWGPARTWLLTVAVTKTALLAWAAVVEDRFETRAVPDLQGWLRPSPFLGVALVLTMLATYGLPGWAVMGARGDLARLAASGPWDALVLLAAFLTLPAYLRWLWLGIGAPTSHVDRAVPELGGIAGRALPTRRLAIRPPARRRGRDETLSVEREGNGGTPDITAGAPGQTAIDDAAPVGKSKPADAAPADKAKPADAALKPATAALAAESAPLATTTLASDSEPAARHRDRQRADADAATRAAEAVRRHRAGLLSGAVLALALLATLVASGAFDVVGAAGEPAPAAAGVIADGG